MFQVKLITEQSTYPEASENLIGRAGSILENHVEHNACAILLSSYDHEQYDHGSLLTRLRSQFPKLPIIGCSSVAEINSETRQVKTDSLNLLLFISDGEVQFEAGIVENLDAEGMPEGVKQAFSETQSRLPNKPKLGFIFPAYRQDICMDSVMVAINNSGLNSNCKLFGGLATECWSTELPEFANLTGKSFQYFNLTVRSN